MEGESPRSALQLRIPIAFLALVLAFIHAEASRFRNLHQWEMTPPKIICVHVLFVNIILCP